MTKRMTRNLHDLKQKKEKTFKKMHACHVVCERPVISSVVSVSVVFQFFRPSHGRPKEPEVHSLQKISSLFFIHLVLLVFSSFFVICFAFPRFSYTLITTTVSL